jgi:uncharacterized membrane protein YkvA (DUF1232 family)
MRRHFRLWRLGKSDLRLLLYALRHPLRPVWLPPATGIMLPYAIEPANFVVPFLGIIDDLVLLPLALHMLLRLLPVDVLTGYARKKKPLG